MLAIGRFRILQDSSTNKLPHRSFPEKLDYSVTESRTNSTNDTRTWHPSWNSLSTTFINVNFLFPHKLYNHIRYISFPWTIACKNVCLQRKYSPSHSHLLPSMSHFPTHRPPFALFRKFRLTTNKEFLGKFTVSFHYSQSHSWFTVYSQHRDLG